MECSRSSSTFWTTSRPTVRFWFPPMSMLWFFSTTRLDSRWMSTVRLLPMVSVRLLRMTFLKSFWACQSMVMAPEESSIRAR